MLPVSKSCPSDGSSQGHSPRSVAIGARLRTLCHNRRCLHPPRNDPHHAKATCCKRLALNPIFSDGLLVDEEENRLTTEDGEPFVTGDDFFNLSHVGFENREGRD